MRLLSYNIHKGVGHDRRYRLSRIHRVIRDLSPDLVCLQEVDWNVGRTRHHDQPRRLADHFGAVASSYQLNVPKASGGYGNLVLSRWPFLGEHHICLRLGARKPRGAQLLIVGTPEGPLLLVNWHLGLSGRERRWQAGRLLRMAHFREATAMPVLVTGDFNDWRDALGRHVFAAHGYEQVTSPATRFRSFPAFLPMAALDKAYYRGPLVIREARVVRTPLTRQASDHLPLAIDFHLRSANGS